MVVQILTTKLFAPPIPLKEIRRPRLIEKLDEGLHRKLTLISAPAGFGKTTLVSQWIAHLESKETAIRAAWLSLDGRESNPISFLIYLAAAIRTTAPDFGAGIFSALQSPQPLPMEHLLTALLNEISDFPAELLLVLDDYHLIESGAVDEVDSGEAYGTVDGALTFLLDHLPPHIHLVITTREDPSLALPRLRARGQLIELRAADLRFSPSEAAEFLHQVMGLSLSAEEMAALETRTEGWIAGLQLAALSMKNHQDVAGFIQAFAGDHRYILDYLMEEVLQRQSECVRAFLLQTSILDRLNGSLCDVVTGQVECHVLLETLERGNYFIVPLDDQRHWFRYHHLFSDVLRVHLMAEQPEQIPALHRRASEWYEQNGLADDAIRHALSGGDFERAAILIERVLPLMRLSRQETRLLSWLKALPDRMFQSHPVLQINYIGTLMQNGQFEGVESRLREVENWLATPEDIREQPVYVDEEDFRRLPGSVAMYHAAIALAQGDVESTMRYTRKVLELAREDDHLPRGAAASLSGLASWASGDLETAYQMFRDGMAHLQRAGFISDVVGGSITLADIRTTQGRLRESMSNYERGLQLATKQGEPPLRGAADMHVGMSELYIERNELNNAERHLLISKELGDLNGLPKNPYRWRVATARLREIRGDLEGALDLLDEAESLYVSDFSPNFRPIPAMKARVWIKQGELGKALNWARERNLSIEEDASYAREFEQITFARILLSQYESGHSIRVLYDAMEFLIRLLKAAEEGGRMGSVIEILVLQALAQQMQEDHLAALSSLERALKLAEPEGYVRIFLAEGSRMEKLIREVDAGRLLPNYTRRLLTAFEAERKGVGEEAPSSTPSTSSSLIEPLSQRELDILRLFKTELSGPEIAKELVIALSTVRTHTKNIYSKLDVNSRRGAVKRAIELGLI